MNAASDVSRQIPLQFGNYQQLDFDSFLTDEHQDLVELLQQVASGQLGHHVYMWGPQGCGKSHLLQAACKIASDANRAVAYVPFELIDQFSPDMLHDLGMLDLVCIDALDNVSGKTVWQQALVWLYNELRDNGHSLLISGQQSPRNLPLDIEDLRSRLNWDLVFQIKLPDDEIKKKVLQQQARNRGFELTDEVIHYLMQRVDRDLVSLISILDKIDEESLIEKRKITIPFVRNILD